VIEANKKHPKLPAASSFPLGTRLKQNSGLWLSGQGPLRYTRPDDGPGRKSFWVLYRSVWVAQKGLIRAKSSFPVKTRPLFLNSGRAAYRPLVQKTASRLFFKAQFVF